MKDIADRESVVKYLESSENKICAWIMYFLDSSS